MITFAELRNRYLFTCEFAAESGLHIGAGAPNEYTDSPMIRQGGRAFIPGSSLRGALRASVERICRSLAIPATAEVCTLFEERPESRCVSATRQSRERFEGKDGEKEFRKLITGEVMLCPICQLFGSTIMAAKLKVGDGEMRREVKSGAATFPLAESFATRDGVGINRDTGSAQDQLKYDYEVLEPGNRFRTVLQLENGTVADFALLYVLFSEWRNGLELGGNRARGLGRTVLKGGRTEYFDAARGYSLLDYLAGGRLREEDGPTTTAFLSAQFDAFAGIQTC